MAGALFGPAYSSYEPLTVSNSAKAFTAATIGDRNFAFVTCEAAAIRFRVDGTDPTATEGHELLVGEKLTLNRIQQLQKFRAIRRDGADATLRCSFG